MVKSSKTVVALSLLIAGLALIAAGTGLFWQDGGDSYSFTTLRGQTAEIYGQGLYRYDTLFVGAGSKGTDAITLFLGIPLLVLSTLLYWRGSLRGSLMLTGALAYFLYVYASYALGTVAYNELFLLYITLFSSSLFALVLAFRSIDLQALPSNFLASLPRLGLAIFLFASGLVTLVVWGSPLVVALFQDKPPGRMDTYTTPVTYALDLAIITPAVFLSSLLILRRAPAGYLIAFPLLVVEAMLAPVITAQTVSQVSAGVSFPPAQIVGPIAGFVVLALMATSFIVSILRNVSASGKSQSARVR